MHGVTFQFFCMMLFAVLVAASPFPVLKNSAAGLHKRVNSSFPDHYRYVDQGNLHCLSENDNNTPGNAEQFTTLDGAETLAKGTCAFWVKSGFKIFNSTQSYMPFSADPPIVDASDPLFSRLVVTVGHAATQRCGKDSTVDFTVDGMQETCVTRLYSIINGCDLKQNNNNLWKQGGMFYRDCTTWTLSKLNVGTQEQ
ncbi:hypothetical protein PISL3812_01379 [Talaromyces islandicus]|uniref:Ecp2 effector protein domain-containing protein n=1 Tax=Talaromyces islandicus TaxID=28573 RepID=A0A0U1LLZ2_TALIS|nr:hypothetical protein PISL3812_01379 [Talaromyces islandicus]